jgi:hypothetical protein
MTHALPLLLALACASDPAAAPPDAEAVEVRVHDFARLTPATAARLEGRRSVYRVDILFECDPGRYVVDGPWPRKSFLKPAAGVRTGRRSVEARLSLEWVPPCVEANGRPRPARWKYCLEEATLWED